MATFWDHGKGAVVIKDTELKNEMLENDNISLFEFNQNIIR